MDRLSCGGEKRSGIDGCCFAALVIVAGLVGCDFLKIASDLLLPALYVSSLVRPPTAQLAHAAKLP